MKFVFVYLPHAGILDVWLPLIAQLRPLLPESEFIFLAPEARLLQKIKTGDAVSSIANEVFDRVLVQSVSDGWVRYPSLGDATSHQSSGPAPGHKKHGTPSSESSFKKSKLWQVARLAGQEIHRARYGSRQAAAQLLQAISPAERGAVLLFDIGQANRASISGLMRIARDWPKFSLTHGYDRAVLCKKVKKERAVLKRAPNTFTLHASELEAQLAGRRYGLPPSRASVVGMTRHDRVWLNELKTRSALADPELPGRFIFVISRPVGGYMPRERKVEALQDVRWAAMTMGVPVVLRQHPHEIEDGVLNEVFGEPSRAPGWFVSESNPMLLAEGCEFVVSLGSGLALDFVWLGVPVVERLDLRGLGITKRDFIGVREADSGEPIFPLRALGLVLGASNRSQFREHVSRIREDRSAVAAQLQQQYQHQFIDARQSVERVLREFVSIGTDA